MDRLQEEGEEGSRRASEWVWGIGEGTLAVEGRLVVIATDLRVVIWLLPLFAQSVILSPSLNLCLAAKPVVATTASSSN
jgi:hypothetical protein